MTTATAGHTAEEELMALLDGELSGAELRIAEEHLLACETCAGTLAALRQERQALRNWTVEAAPEGIETETLTALKSWSRQAGSAGSRRVSPRARPWIWAGAGAGIVAAGALSVGLVLMSGGRSSRPSVQPTVLAEVPSPQSEAAKEARDGTDSDRNAEPASVAGLSVARPAPPVMAEKMAAPAGATRMVHALPVMPPPEIASPMIAKTVALTITVKDVERSREGLENLLRAYSGYAAQMQVSTPDSGGQSLQASLRVPSGQLRGLLAELKGFGKVESETQSGEEVSEQHADLVARLNTSRESEERLRGILRTRTGDVAEVLEVEQEIARVRGEIEGMEAEQKGLEHRVSYATVDVQMNQEGSGPAAQSAWSRLGAGAHEGWENAEEAVVRLVLFLLEYGLAIVLVAAIVGVPLWIGWKRWRKVRTRW